MDLLLLSDLAQSSEQLLRRALADPGPLTVALVFGGGALTSLGPCSLSLLPVTLAYLAGFEDGQPAWRRSLAFCSGIVGALVVLGSVSGLLGVGAVTNDPRAASRAQPPGAGGQSGNSAEGDMSGMKSLDMRHLLN